jgi:hypothetical protein
MAAFEIVTSVVSLSVVSIFKFVVNRVLIGTPLYTCMINFKTIPVAIPINRSVARVVMMVPIKIINCSGPIL